MPLCTCEHDKELLMIFANEQAGHFLVPDVVRATGGFVEYTVVFHLLRDLVDEGVLAHDEKGYSVAA